MVNVKIILAVFLGLVVLACGFFYFSKDKTDLTYSSPITRQEFLSSYAEELVPIEFISNDEPNPEKELVPEPSVTLNDGAKDVRHGKIYERRGDLMISYPLNIPVMYYPDDHPLHDSQKVTFQYDIENIVTGLNYSIRTTTLTPKESYTIDLDFTQDDLIKSNKAIDISTWELSDSFDTVYVPVDANTEKEVKEFNNYIETTKEEISNLFSEETK